MKPGKGLLALWLMAPFIVAAFTGCVTKPVYVPGGQRVIAVPAGSVVIMSRSGRVLNPPDGSINVSQPAWLVPSQTLAVLMEKAMRYDELKQKDAGK